MLNKSPTKEMQSFVCVCVCEQNGYLNFVIYFIEMFYSHWSLLGEFD